MKAILLLSTLDKQTWNRDTKWNIQKKLQIKKNIISNILYLGVELLELAAVIVEPEASLIIGALEHLFKGPGAFPGAPSTSIAEFDDDIREPFSYQHLTSILPSISARLSTDM